MSEFIARIANLVVRLTERTSKLEERVRQLERENWALAKNISAIERSLRIVCVETETPIHFGDK